MKHTWMLLGRVAYWCAWPALFIYLYFSTRTRVLVVAGDKVLVVKGWLGDGRWMLPGGGLQRGEDTARGAARELREETGIEIDPKQLRCVSTSRVRDNGHSYNQELLVLEVSKEMPLLRQQWELVAAQWLPWYDLCDDKSAHPVLTQLLLAWFRDRSLLE